MLTMLVASMGKRGRSLARGVLAAALSFAASAALPGVAAEYECLNTVTEATEMRILGGREADPRNWEFVVALASTANADQFCGGSLIHPQWVLTAAHCTHNRNGAPFEASAVSVHRVAPDGSVDDAAIVVEKYFVHPGYADDSMPDVALLRLVEPFDIGRDSLAFIANERTEAVVAPEGTCLEVAGWGHTEFGADKGSSVLLDVGISLLPAAACGRYGPDTGLARLDPEQEICAGYTGGGHDSCHGDSGGPLLVRDGPNGYLLLGTVSRGGICGEAGMPGIYARLSAVREWIFETVEADK